MTYDLGHSDLPSLGDSKGYLCVHSRKERRNRAFRELTSVSKTIASADENLDPLREPEDGRAYLPQALRRRPTSP
jgi:hypothetical protein